MYRSWGKRTFDFILAGMGLIILFPLFVLISLSLIISGQRNPFFLQLRPGLHSIPFTIIKFKTMIEPTSSQNQAISDHDRITKLGKILRKTSLDELPQLWNVLIGNMSLVGPRPLLLEYVPLYNDFQNQRHQVKPGITGWAQVHGRNALDWQQRLDMDVWYTQNMTLLLDLKIIAKTCEKLFYPASTPPTETDIPEKFKG